jgi:hypothetical protein
MGDTYNIYCDESCHLLRDNRKVFVLGAIWVKKSETARIFADLRALKAKHGLSPTFEAKWTKISAGKADYYCELVKYFFDSTDLHFRGVVVPDKAVLNHAAFAQDHNTWYYKMFYILLDVVIRAGAQYNLFLDIKDTRSHAKILELKRILNITRSEESAAVPNAQQIRSNEVELMQLVDILAGALSYIHRGLSTNQGKKRVIDVIGDGIGKNMLISSPRTEDKFNVLVWRPRETKA